MAELGNLLPPARRRGGGTAQQPPTQAFQNPRREVPAALPGTRDFPLYTSQSRGALYVPQQMTAKDFQLLKQQIENSLAVIEATAVVESED